MYYRKPHKSKTKQFISWNLRYEYGKRIPMSREYLLRTKRQHLLAIIGLIDQKKPRGYWRDMVGRDNSRLIAYILTNQGTQPLDPGPNPVLRFKRWTPKRRRK